MSEQEWLEQFADNLKTIMDECGYNQKQLAAEVGTTEATISRYLNYTQIPKAPVLINIAYALDCSLDDLMDFNERIIL